MRAREAWRISRERAPAIQNPPPASSSVNVGDDGAEIVLTAEAIKSYVVTARAQLMRALGRK